MNRKNPSGLWHVPVRVLDGTKIEPGQRRPETDDRKPEEEHKSDSAMNENDRVDELSESPAAEPAQNAAAEPPATVDDPQARLAEMEDRWKRAAADLDNYRKRMDREVLRLQMAERERVLRSWLPVIDNMERALCAEGASNNPWYEGMEAIHQQMLSVLAQFGVQPFVPMGESFDPHQHDAVATANLPDQPDGLIVDVVQTGYVLDGRVLRPAKVVAVRKVTLET